MKTGLVVSAHPGDFVWRAGGAIALHAKRGFRVKIVCLSYGERGESQFAWKEPGASLASVKKVKPSAHDSRRTSPPDKPGQTRPKAYRSRHKPGSSLPAQPSHPQANRDRASWS